MIIPQFYLEIVLLIMASSANLMISVFVYLFGYKLSEKKDISTRYFALSTFYVFVWSLGLFLSRIFNGANIGIIERYGIHLLIFGGGGLIMYYLAHFGAAFRYEYNRSAIRKVSWAIRLMGALYFLVIIIPGVGIWSPDPLEPIRHQTFAHVIFSVISILYGCVYMSMLVATGRDKSEGLKYRQTKLLYIATLLAMGGGMFTNIIYPLLTSTGELGYVGPVFTLLVTISVAFGIIRLRLFSIPSQFHKTFLVLSGVVLVFMIRLVVTLPYFQNEIWLNAGLFLVFCLLTGVLIREVYRGAKRQYVLDSKKKQLEYLLHSKDEFMRTSSHQLRTPLTIIIGYLSMMTAGEKQYRFNHRAQTDLSKIYVSALNLNNIINDLLAANDIHAGKFGISIRDEVNLKDVVEKIIKDKKSLLREKSTEVSLKVKGVDFITVVDLPKIREAINNILDNAVYYGRGKIWITVDSSQVKQFIIKIRDNGIGIAPSNLKKIGHKFERGDHSAVINPNGSGLGVYLARMIMKEHGGDLEITSRGEGKGSTVILSLPRVVHNARHSH